jgi:hypothetical protein
MRKKTVIGNETLTLYPRSSNSSLSVIRVTGTRGASGEKIYGKGSGGMTSLAVFTARDCA